MREWLFKRLIASSEKLTRTSLLMAGYQRRMVPMSFGDLALLECAGPGRIPVMLLHGFSAEGVHYTPVMRRLRPHVSRLYVPDLPAHGLSACPPKGMSPADLRAQIISAFDRILVEPTVLFGNSLGGLVALYYALARPEKVRGLILCSPGGAEMNGEELAEVLRLFQIESVDDALAFVDKIFVKPTVLRRLIATGVRDKFANPNLKTLMQSLRPGEFLRPEEIAALAVPTLLTWGKHDRILPRSSLAFFREHLPRTTVIEEPPGHSHTPYLEDPGGMATRIVSFLLSLDDKRAAIP